MRRRRGNCSESRFSSASDSENRRDCSNGHEAGVGGAWPWSAATTLLQESTSTAPVVEPPELGASFRSTHPVADTMVVALVPVADLMASAITRRCSNARRKRSQRNERDETGDDNFRGLHGNPHRNAFRGVLSRRRHTWSVNSSGNQVLLGRSTARACCHWLRQKGNQRANARTERWMRSSRR